MFLKKMLQHRSLYIPTPFLCPGRQETVSGRQRKRPFRLAGSLPEIPGNRLKASPSTPGSAALPVQNWKLGCPEPKAPTSQSHSPSLPTKAFDFRWVPLAERRRAPKALFLWRLDTVSFGAFQKEMGSNLTSQRLAATQICPRGLSFKL